MGLRKINSSLDLPKYVIVFGVFKEYLDGELKGIKEYAEKIEPDALQTDCVKVTLKPTFHVDFSEFNRKGSVEVNGYFIHDDYRYTYDGKNDLEVFLVT